MKKEYLVSAKEMKQYDDNTIYKTGIPSLVLMERASMAVADCVMQYLKSPLSGRILVVAGNGNNGADGICAARILAEYGYGTEICLLKSKCEYTKELLLQKQVADTYGIPFLKEEEVDFAKYAVVVDAIFGNGLNRDVEGTAKEMICRINDSNRYVVSVDIPSGINASGGEVCGVAIKADETVTFGFYKCGQFFYPGREYCGKITKALIGIDETSFYGLQPAMFTYSGSVDEKCGLSRDASGNKGTFGKVLVIAGRESTTGAALLCAASALRGGAGMVAVFTQEGNKEAFLASYPEVMVETYALTDTEKEKYAKLDKWLAWADVCVIGCGLSTDETAYKLLSHTLSGFSKPIVADADALNLFAKHEDLKEKIISRKKNDNTAPVVFTPHPGELATLMHCDIATIKKNRLLTAKNACMEYGVILVAKDADTLCMAENESIYLNTSGNDGMSTAGSGDVLAGLIGAFMAQGVRAGIPLFEAVCMAVYVHGLAGDYQALRSGKAYMVASDIIEAYKYILK